MKKTVVIIGGGVGGTIIANAVVHSTTADDADMILISDNAKHEYQPHYISVALGYEKPDAIIHEEQNLLSDRIKFVHEKATNIDAKAKTVTSQRGAKFAYDYLVIAAGARLQSCRDSRIRGFSTSLLRRASCPKTKRGSGEFYRREDTWWESEASRTSVLPHR